MPPNRSTPKSDSTSGSVGITLGIGREIVVTTERAVCSECRRFIPRRERAVVCFNRDRVDRETTIVSRVFFCDELCLADFRWKQRTDTVPSQNPEL